MWDHSYIKAISFATPTDTLPFMEHHGPLMHLVHGVKTFILFILCALSLLTHCWQICSRVGDQCKVLLLYIYPNISIEDKTFGPVHG